MSTPLQDLLRREANDGDTRHDWEVRTDPEGTTVKAWTAETFTDVGEAMTAASVLLDHVLGLGFVQAGGCEVGTRRDNPDEAWRGWVMVRLSPA
jgi:hypothetical protein